MSATIEDRVSDLEMLFAELLEGARPKDPKQKEAAGLVLRRAKAVREGRDPASEERSR